MRTDDDDLQQRLVGLVIGGLGAPGGCRPQGTYA